MKNKRLTAEQLRKSILQLAIQGKLVKQDPNDEPASVLVDKIYAEKEKLIAAGKIKKDKNESRIYKRDDNRYYEKIGKETKDITDELPFDIPESWTWLRLSNIANIYTGNSINEEEKKRKYFGLIDGYNYIATKDVNFDKTINYINGVKIPFETNFRIAPKSKVLMCIEGGSAGRKIGLLNEDVCFGNKLACFNTFFSLDMFLYYYLQSPLFTEVFKDELSGIIGGVSINKIKTLFIPIPPLTEQQRIVDKIEFLNPYLDRYEEVESELYELDSTIKEKLKKSILQYAIQGKLVNQDPNDEPASVLLERIKAEKEQLIKEGKIKREKNESVIYQGDDKNYYEKFGNNIKLIESIFTIPSSWRFIRFKNLAHLITCGYASTPRYESAGIPFISAKNVKPLNFIFSNYKYISDHLYNKIHANYKPEFGDILLTRVGAGIGEACIIDVYDDFGIYVSLTLIKMSKIISNKYILFLLLSPYGMMLSNKNTSGKEASQGNLNVENVRDFVVPIPPLNEQLRIVSKIEKLNDFIQFN